jgi:hypothetical protein
VRTQAGGTAMALAFQPDHAPKDRCHQYAHQLTGPISPSGRAAADGTQFIAVSSLAEPRPAATGMCHRTPDAVCFKAAMRPVLCPCSGPSGRIRCITGASGTGEAA